MDKGKMERLGTPWVRGVCSPGHVTEYSQNMAEKPASVEVYCLTKQQVRFLEVLI